jgi:hypothetical protein
MVTQAELTFIQQVHIHLVVEEVLVPQGQVQLDRQQQEMVGLVLILGLLGLQLLASQLMAILLVVAVVLYMEQELLEQVASVAVAQVGQMELLDKTEQFTLVLVAVAVVMLLAVKADQA